MDMKLSQSDQDTLKLADLGFLHPRFFDDEHWGAVITMGSFACIVDGDRSAISVGYQNRWLYRSIPQAVDALKEWNGQVEPAGFISSRLDAVMTVWP